MLKRSLLAVCDLTRQRDLQIGRGNDTLKKKDELTGTTKT